LIRVSLLLILIEAFGFGYWPRGLENNDLSNIIDKTITLVALIVMLPVILIFHKSIIKNTYNRSLMFINIILFSAILSSLFADDVMYSLKIAIRLTLFYFFIIGILNYDSSIIWEAIYKFIPFFIASNLLVIFLFPSLGIESGVRAGTWRGLLVFKTQFGLCCVFLATFLYAYSKSRFGRVNKRSYLYILLLTLMCLGSQSFVALGILFLYFWVLAFASFYRKFDYKFKTIIVISLIVIISVLVVMFENYSSEIFTRIGKSDSIYSRFKMWELIFDGYIESPLLGYGLGRYLSSAGVLENIQETLWFFELSSMHNSYLEWALGAGTIAGVCYIIINLRGLRTCINDTDQTNDSFNILLGPMLVGFVGGFITSSIAFSNLFWLAPITLSFFYKSNEVTFKGYKYDN
jgi:O-antigen ligase